MNDVLSTAQLQSVDAIQLNMAFLRLPGHLPGQQERVKDRGLASAVSTRQDCEICGIQAQIAKPLEILQTDLGNHRTTPAVTSRTLPSRARTLRLSPVLLLIELMKS